MAGRTSPALLAANPEPLAANPELLAAIRSAARGHAPLGIAERTMKVHLGSVFRRIGVSDRTSAAMLAREHLPEA